MIFGVARSGVHMDIVQKDDILNEQNSESI